MPRSERQAVRWRFCEWAERGCAFRFVPGSRARDFDAGLDRQMCRIWTLIHAVEAITSEQAFSDPSILSSAWQGVGKFVRSGYN